MKQAYVDKTFSRSSQALIDQANEIIKERGLLREAESSIKEQLDAHNGT